MFNKKTGDEDQGNNYTNASKNLKKNAETM